MDVLVEGPGRDENAQAADVGLLEVEYSADQITVWGWSGSKLEAVGATMFQSMDAMGTELEEE